MTLYVNDTLIDRNPGGVKLNDTAVAQVNMNGKKVWPWTDLPTATDIFQVNEDRDTQGATYHTFTVNLNDYVDTKGAPVVRWEYNPYVVNEYKSEVHGADQWVANEQTGEYSIRLYNFTLYDNGYTRFYGDFTVVTEVGTAHGLIEWHHQARTW
jgi:hypothetical protein